MKSERILIVDDTPANLTLLSHTLEPLGYEIIAASNGDQALKLAGSTKPDLILLDVMMPGRDGFAVCKTLKSDPATRGIPVIFLTAKQETESVVRGLKAGAVDYVFKPFQAEEVLSRVETHLKLSRLTRELQARNVELVAEIERRTAAEKAREVSDERLSSMNAREAKRWGLGLVGESQHLRQVLSDIQRLHEFGKTTVLITGESGTGKELIARAIHHHSPRVSGPFVPVNCVAVPGELAESLFFGHVKGSFTGATGDRKGYFEMADGGTLFLDEIGDMPAVLQAKLLRVLEDGEVTPVGSAQSRKVDVRVVAATNADMPGRIGAGEFRQDLYYRLARYTVVAPPLRERPGDIALLAAHFLEVFSAEMGRTPPALTDEALARLAAYSFPGNVRELKNMIERALILSAGKTIQPVHLQFLETSASASAMVQTGKTSAVSTELPLNIEAAEQALIQRALEQTDGNVAEAARLLGVNRSRIYRRFTPSGST